MTLPITLSLIALPLLYVKIRSKIFDFCSLRTIVLWLTLAFGVAFLMAVQVTWYDSNLYHVGKIRWLAEYGTLPGLYLIQDRFGWTSSWFALSAFLNPTFIDYRAIAIANGFILVMTFFHFFLSIRQIVKGNGRLADWFVAIAYLILLPVLLFKDLPFLPPGRFHSPKSR